MLLLIWLLKKVLLMGKVIDNVSFTKSENNSTDISACSVPLKIRTDSVTVQFTPIRFRIVKGKQSRKNFIDDHFKIIIISCNKFWLSL